MKQQQFNSIVESAQNGNVITQDLLKLTYSELVLSDLHLQIGHRMKVIADIVQLGVREEKKRVNAIKKHVEGVLFNAKQIDKDLCNDLGVDDVANNFGDRADVLQDIIKDIVFMSNDDLLKVHSTIKILNR